jgi:hypothetical protein
MDAPQPMGIPQPMNAHQPPPPSFYVYESQSKKVYPVDAAETVLALVVVMLGFLFWNWFIPRSGDWAVAGSSADLEYGGFYPDYYPGIAITLFFVLALATSLIYFQARKVTLSQGGMIGAGIVFLSALPFAIYSATPLHFFAIIFTLGLYVLWHAYAANTAIAKFPGVLTSADLLNQTLVVPFSNMGAWFAGLRSFGHKGKGTNQVIAAIVGIIIAVPIFAIIIALLASADAQFSTWIEGIGVYFENLKVGRYVLCLTFGFPVGFYIFALLYGNARRMGTETMTPKSLLSTAQNARKVSIVAVGTPVAILVLIYGVFLAAVVSNLHKTMTTVHSPDFTYAEFARRGFFELAVVAGINLVILGFIYLFCQRKPGPYPVFLRVLGSTMSALTLVMVVLSITKMLMYWEQYGLTRLRVYTMWFMCVMFVVFALLLVWHLRRFKVGTAIVMVMGLSFLGLTWANVDSIIANHNVDRYLSGQVETIDVDYLGEDLSDAAVPALIRLSEDRRVQAQANRALAIRRSEGTNMLPAGDAPWTAWSWESHRAHQLL